MKQRFTIQVNGDAKDVTADPATPLLYILRNNLHLKAPKFGCGLGQCGACMILINGSAVASCQTKLEAVKNKEITTLEGLVHKDGTLHKVQQAFVTEQAAQCGYCMNGMIIGVVSLLNKNNQPTEADIRKSLQNNICRCGVHHRIIRAVQLAAKL